MRPSPLRGLTIGLLMSIFFVLPLFSHAADGIGKSALQDKLRDAGNASGFDIPSTTTGRTLSAVGLARTAGHIVQSALVLIGVIFLTLTVYGGVMYLTASGNEEQVKKAVQIITNAIIGILIVIFAGVIIKFLDNQISRPVVPLAPGNEYTATTLLGGCPTGYTYILLATPVTIPSPIPGTGTNPQILTGPACRRQ